MYFSDEVIEVCKNCHGIKPCWCECDEKSYVHMEKWIYDLIKQLNPV